MTNHIAAFSIPKIGENNADIQDAFKASDDRCLAAIADGASSSLFPRQWADILVNNFCIRSEISVEGLRNGWQDWLKPLQEEWRKYYLLNQPQLPWWAKGSEHKNHGASTFIGLKINPPNFAGERIWEAIAIGDSCLFKINFKSNKLESFPIRHSQEFRTVTECFPSLPEYKSVEPSFRKGWCKEGDVFLLATDAIAQWILADYEANLGRWRDLIYIETEEQFYSFINKLRHDKLIHNDDTTLALVKISKVSPKQSNIQSSQQPYNSNSTNQTGAVQTSKRVFSGSTSNRSQQINQTPFQTGPQVWHPHHNSQNLTTHQPKTPTPEPTEPTQVPQGLHSVTSQNQIPIQQQTPAPDPASLAALTNEPIGRIPDVPASTLEHCQPLTTVPTYPDPLENEIDGSANEANFRPKKRSKNLALRPPEFYQNKIRMLLIILLLSLTVNAMLAIVTIYSIVTNSTHSGSGGNRIVFWLKPQQVYHHVWAHAPLDYIDKNKRILKIPPGEQILIYADIQDKPDRFLPFIGYLEPGICSFSKAILSEDDQQSRWLKIQVDSSNCSQK